MSYNHRCVRLGKANRLPLLLFLANFQAQPNFLVERSTPLLTLQARTPMVVMLCSKLFWFEGRNYHSYQVVFVSLNIENY